MISRVISRFVRAGQWWRHAVNLIALTCCLMQTANAAPEVVTSIKPLQLIAAAITDGISIPQLVMDGGHDPHHVVLRPSDRRKLQEADIALWVGPTMELPLQDVMSQLTATVITAQQVPEMHLLEVEGATDPHLWLDSRNARLVAGALTDTLKHLDPDNSARYAANLDAFVHALATTDAEIAALLSPHKATPWTASHQAFGYFTRQFGLQPPLTLTDSSNNAPGVRRAVELREAIVTRQIQCLLTETSENPAQLDALLQDTKLHIVGADVLGIDLETGASGYTELMLALAHAMASCLEGVAG